MPSITLCTYTYNDAHLARGLLASVPAWTLRPDHIIVVDDGSEPPFALPEDTGGIPAQLVRLPENQGTSRAKAAGLSRAATDLVLSLDCDMRLAPNWLAQAVPLALRPDVGIVGGPFVTDAGQGVVGRYLHRFDAEKKPSGETDFVTGGIWLFRREVWLAADGFGGYARRTYVDHHFCARVKQLGLRLFITGDRGCQARRLSRIALAKRIQAWIGPGLRRESASPDALSVKALNLADLLMYRSEYALRLNEPLFVYIEMLLLAVLGTCCCEGLKESRPDEAAACAGALAHGLLDLCRPFPRLAALLRSDLAALGLAPSEAAAECPVWREALDGLAAMARGGTFAHMEKFLPLLLEEDGDRADFSYYTDLPADHL